MRNLGSVAAVVAMTMTFLSGAMADVACPQAILGARARTRTVTPSAPRLFRPAVEGLESRIVPVVPATGVSAGLASSTSVVIDWNDANDPADESAVYLERSDNGGGFYTVQTLAPGARRAIVFDGT